MLSAREYAKLKGVKVVGKLRMSYEGYGFDRKQKVWIDEAGLSIILVWIIQQLF